MGGCPLIAAVSLTCLGEEESFKTDAYLIEPGQPARKIHLLDGGGNTVRYREREGAGDEIEIALGAGAAVFVCEPPEFAEAMDLFQGRKYQEAKIQFGQVKQRHEPIENMADSYAMLAAFYEMECFRKLGDLKGLAAALQDIPKATLTREWQLRQLELYVLWDAVRTENWVRLEDLAKERLNVKLSGDQRAQVAYCHGLALEGLKRPREALPPYHVALTAGAGAAEDVARKAALRILSIYHDDPEVRQALEAREKKVGKCDPLAEAKLSEATAVAALFKEFLGADSPLPKQFEGFLK